ncbi:FUSC family protein, partial [Streptomyces sp. YIM 130001]|uniref:FUSC family protein n=1 Tax=Streptomyces sp. YIM 130001 TaxID=2259644 RepID=UPI0019693597
APESDPGAASAPLDGSAADPGLPSAQNEPEPESDPDADTPEPPPVPLVRPSLLELIPVALRAMRDQVRRKGPIRRHAIRVTAVGVTGYLIGNALPLGHGYWAPLTSVMVMRPDFSQTYGRAVARFGGTLLGVGLATGVVQLVDPDAPLAGVLAIACAGLTYLLMRTGYAVSQVTISAYVVFLLGMGGEALSQTVPERVLLTLVGGVLAMLGYALYPAWETPRLRNRLADWLAADGRYAAAVVRHYAEPVDHPNSAVRDTLLDARTARLAWQDAVARAQSEPVRHRGLSRSAADDAEHALARIARAAMLMEAHLPEHGTTPVPSAARLADAIEEGTKDAARAVRERQVPDWEPIRAALEAWTGEGVPDRVVRQGADLLMEAFEELSEAMGTTDVPMSVQGTDNSARNKVTSRNETKPRDSDGSQQPGKDAQSGKENGTQRGGKQNGTQPPDGTTPR